MTGKDYTCSSSTFSEKIVLLRQDLELLPLSHIERYFLKKLRKLTEKEQAELLKIIESKNCSKISSEQLKVLREILEKI